MIIRLRLRLSFPLWGVSSPIYKKDRALSRLPVNVKRMSAVTMFHVEQMERAHAPNTNQSLCQAISSASLSSQRYVKLPLFCVKIFLRAHSFPNVGRRGRLLLLPQSEIPAREDLAFFPLRGEPRLDTVWHPCAGRMVLGHGIDLARAFRRNQGNV